MAFGKNILLAPRAVGKTCSFFIESMPAIQAKQDLPASAPRPRIVWKHVVVWLVVAFLIGAVLNYSTTKLGASSGPAGFRRGILHGALMPMAMPNLLVGND